MVRWAAATSGGSCCRAVAADARPAWYSSAGHVAASAVRGRGAQREPGPEHRSGHQSQQQPRHQMVAASISMSKASLRMRRS